MWRVDFIAWVEQITGEDGKHLCQRVLHIDPHLQVTMTSYYYWKDCELHLELAYILKEAFMWIEGLLLLLLKTYYNYKITHI